MGPKGTNVSRKCQHVTPGKRVEWSLESETRRRELENSGVKDSLVLRGQEAEFTATWAALSAGSEQAVMIMSRGEEDPHAARRSGRAEER